MDYPVPGQSLQEDISRNVILTPLGSQKALKNADGTKRFSVQEINAIPIGGYALQLIAMLLFAWLSSRTGWRATWIVVQMVGHCCQ